MSWIDGVRHRLRALLNADQHARDVEEEMRLHLDLAHMHDKDERSAALSFGNYTRYREEVRRMTWMRFVDVVTQDARYAWRSLTRSRAFTAMIVMTLALGIGVNAAAFSVLDMLFLQPPGGVAEPDKVRRFYAEHFATGDGVPFIAPNMTFPQYRQFAAAVGDSTRIAMFMSSSNTRMGRHPRDPRARTVYAMSSYFHILGVTPAIGRLYTTAEDRIGAGVPVAVVSHRFWRDRLGGDTAAIGRQISIGSLQYTVVGVLDPAFSGLELQAADVWVPMSTLPADAFGPGPWWVEDNSFAYEAIFRVDDALEEQHIVQRATANARNMERASTSSRRDTLMRVMSGSIIAGRGPARADDAHLISSRLSVVAALVMAIAFANVVNLLLARAVHRRHEFAIRLSLGISPRRLLRMLTTESVMLALVAMIPAMAAAFWGGAFLRKLLMPDIEWIAPAVTMRVMVFTLTLTLSAGLLAGLIPALQSRNAELSNALKGTAGKGQRHRSRLRSGLLATQAAFSVVLLVGAVLFVRSLYNVQSIDIGYEAPRLVFARLAFAEGETPPRPVINAKLEEVAAQLDSRPSVEAIAMAAQEPMRGNTGMRVQVSGDTAGIGTAMLFVSKSFHRAVGMKLLQGDEFSGALYEVIVNRKFAERAWPGENPLGKCVKLGGPTPPCYAVIGVVGDAPLSRVLEEDRPEQIFLPFTTRSAMGFATSLIVRTAGDESATIVELRTTLARAFPAAEPVVRSMRSYLEPQYRKWRVGAMLFSAVGILALVVALIGIYSTMTYAVAQRTHEFGVRIAHGAVLGDLLKQVVGESVRVVFIGVVAGIVMAFAASRLIESLLYGVSVHDIPTTIGVSLSMLAAAALATVGPAMRAARVDPVESLRAE